MKPFDRFKSVDDLLEQTLDLAPSERQALLERVEQTEPELANRVRSMLAKLCQAESGALHGVFVTELASQELARGQQLGNYQIEHELGKGGMGLVYAARDLRLERNVAIKVLPSHLTHDPGLRKRFLREARAISQLQHPNICVLFDVGEQDGIDYLVMERLEGESLQQRLERSSLPFDEAVRIGIEVARALDHAHRAGVVHRDVKPGNIFLTAEGAKLMDFGLARRDAPKAAAGTEAATLQEDALTAEGTILGTLQYMAPEQLEGKEATVQTDVFAFGAVLYEMLTHRRSFEGDSQAAFISAVLRDEPSSVSELQPASTPALDRLVGLCLEKKPERRWQSMADLARELQFVANEGASSPGTVSKPLPPASIGRRAWPWLAAAVTFLAGLAVGSQVLSNGGATVAPPPASVTRQLNLIGLDRAGGQQELSPNGRFLVSRERLIGAGVNEVGGGGIFEVSAGGGEARNILKPEPNQELLAPSLLPGGQHLLHHAQVMGEMRGQIRVTDLKTGEAKTLADDGRDPQFHPQSGLLLFGRRAFVLGGRFDPEELEWIDDPRVVLEHVWTGVGYGTHQYSLSDRGDLVAGLFPAMTSKLVLVDRKGQEQTLAEEPTWLNRPRIAPDDQTILVAKTRNILDSELWMYHRDGRSPERVTFRGGTHPLIINDGRSIVFSSIRGLDTWNLFYKDLGTRTQARPLYGCRCVPLCQFTGPTRRPCDLPSVRPS